MGDQSTDPNAVPGTPVVPQPTADQQPEAGVADQPVAPTTGDSTGVPPVEPTPVAPGGDMPTPPADGVSEPAAMPGAVPPVTGGQV